jgi:hypothetical protein
MVDRVRGVDGEQERGAAGCLIGSSATSGALPPSMITLPRGCVIRNQGVGLSTRSWLSASATLTT